jgi:hypothetical protein
MQSKEKVLITDLRESLKGVIQNELLQISEQLEAMEPKERLNIVCKLMPYVFPKVETIHLQQGEKQKPFEFD